MTRETHIQAQDEAWKCTCNGCGKVYTYGDENSPVVYPKVWRSILKYWGISEEEQDRRYAQYTSLFKKWNRLEEGKEKAKVFEEMRKPEYHTQFCTECMEKALGRPLEKSDVDHYLPHNRAFFRKFEEKAK
jgi:hypothetical protein